MWILTEEPGGLINLNYVTRIYLEYGTKVGEKHKILADFKESVVCLKSYETKEEVLEGIRLLGAEMARTGIAISIEPSMEKLHNSSGRSVKSNPTVCENK